MNEKMNFKNIFKNSTLLVALIAITLFTLFHDNNIEGVFTALCKAKLNFVLIAVACVFLFICCEALNIRRTLKLLGYSCRYIQCLKYSFIGFFFSSVTPSASGGQPMQVYYMSKDQIEISHSSLALLLELASYQFVTISMAVIGFFINYNFIGSINPRLKFMLAAGVMINTCVFICIIFALFSKGVVLKVVNFLFILLFKLKIKKAEVLKEKTYSQIDKYHIGASYIKNNKEMMLLIIFTTIIQVGALHSVTFLVYRAFGLAKFSYVSVLSLQAVLYIAVSAIPLPGAVGVSEGGFMKLFVTLFPAGMLGPAMLLSRGISFYLFVVISGFAVLMAQLFTEKSSAVSRIKNASKSY